MLQNRIRAATIGLLVAVPLHGQARDTVPAGRDSAAVELPSLLVVASILPVAGPAVGPGLPARAATVSGAAVDAWEPRLLPEALASQPGISLYDDLGSPFKATLAIRGFAASPVVGLPQGVSVFLDGVPVNEPDARQVNFDLLPLEHVRAVELLSGTAALLGPNSLGGAVNLVTRHGGGEAEGEIEVAAGSFGTRSVEGAVGGDLGGMGYYAGGGWRSERGWREVTSAEQLDAFLSIGRTRPERGYRLQAYAARSYAETAGSLPLSVYRGDPRANLTAGDFEDLSQLHLALAGYGRLGGGRGSFSLYLRAHGAERFNVNQAADPDVRSFSENRTLGASADWRWVQSAAGATLGVRVGATAAGHRTGVRIFAERIDPGITTHVRSPISEGGVFGVVDYLRGPVTVSGGARLDGVRVPFRNRLDSARDTTSAYVELNPRIGVAVDVGGGASLYGSVARSFRAPAVIELACADPEDPCPLPFALGDDPPLDPVTAVTGEGGIRWLRGPAVLSASVYRTDVRDDIFLFPYSEGDEPQGSTIDGYFANVDATRREGVELASHLAFRGGHSAYLNYAWTRATFRVDDIELFSIREEAGGENEVEKGDRLPLVPDHTLHAGFDLALPGGVGLGAASRYTGERFLRGDEANEEAPLGGYFVADLRVALSRGPWELQALVGNVFDSGYAAFGTFNLYQGGGGVLERFLTPGEPRTLRVVLRRSWGPPRR
ncbi:MAG: TonB-dependent receptor [Gemmatimonadota bacterium]